MKEVDKEIDKMRVEDYNRVINILSPVDTTKLKAQSAQLEDILKKASLPIQKHKNSKWVDDSYIIVGKTRFYQGEWPMAIETFKYVNSKSPDDYARHEALINLMRLFLTAEIYDNAQGVNDYLKKQKLNNVNKREYHLTLAQFYLIKENYKESLKALQVALPYLKKRDKKSRMNFIAGQLNQLLGNDSAAFKHYKQTLKHNPPYELSFYTKLYMAQVTSLKKQSDKRRIEKYFKKLLKDEKNEEYKDKIYYELARFELKQNNIPKGIDYLKQSVSVSKGNNYQKAYSYLKLGELHYEKLQKYELSKLYYDSAVALLDKNDKNYKLIANRLEDLTEFVQQIKIIQLEDSLQKLAKMDSVTLAKHIDNVIAHEAEELKRQEAIAKKKSETVTTPTSNLPGFPGESQGNWIFDNPVAYSAGKIDFQKKWGQRKLEDNWRRSLREKNDFDNPDDSNVVLTSMEEKDKSKKDKSSAEPEAVDKSPYYKNIPFTEEQMIASNARVEKAMFQLGKIYHQKLEEERNAIETYNTFLGRFNESELKPEVLYTLYLIYKNKNNNKYEEYADILHNQFPNSIYSKLIKNPNHLSDSKELNKIINGYYKQSYELYKKGSYFDADSILKFIKRNYPDNDINDKVALLEIMIIGQTKNALIYKAKLEEFLTQYNTSSTVPVAKGLLAAAEQYIADKNTKGESVSEEQIKFSTEVKDKSHLFIILVEKGSKKENDVLKTIKDFNKTNASGETLTTELISANENMDYISVKTFSDKSMAMIYLTQLKNYKPFESVWKSYGIDPMVITEGNFELLYKTSGNNKVYREFFHNNYNN